MSFDDGSYDGVRRIIVGTDMIHGVTSIKIEYMKGDIVEEHEHGGLQTAESSFIIDYPNEYITLIAADYYSYQTRTILCVQFRTSLGRKSKKFGEDCFELMQGRSMISRRVENYKGDGTKLLAFHGRTAGGVITEIKGKFAVHSPAVRSFMPEGGSYGVMWDDGAFDAIKTIWVGEGPNHLTYCKFNYSKELGTTGENPVTRSHRDEPLVESNEFVLLNDEYISSMEGTYDTNARPRDRVLLSLRFITSTGRSSPLFGRDVGTKFVIQGEGVYTKLVGFRGTSEPNRLNSIGGNFTVAPPLKIDAMKGGDFGDRWDDGIHQNLQSITVSSSMPNIASVRFNYLDDYGFLVPGDEHGNPACEHRESTFKLDRGEYITAIEGFVTKHGHNTDAITSLEITTNRRTRELGYDLNGPIFKCAYGSEESRIFQRRFSLGERGYKIVGFFGKSSVYLEEIGVYLMPIDH